MISITSRLGITVFCVAMFIGIPYLPAMAATGCYDCHGTRGNHDIRPADAAFRNPSSGGFPGSHRTHMGSGAVPATCTKCHPGSDSYKSYHRDGRIRLDSRINSSPQATAYNNRTTAWPQSATPQLSSCTNINCHFEKTTDTWGTPSQFTTCNSCHSAPPTGTATVYSGGAAGSHAKHDSYYTGPANCVKCHPDHTADQQPFAHATSAGKRGLVVTPRTPANVPYGRYSTAAAPITGYLPSQAADHAAKLGVCQNTYCHSDGLGHPPTTQPKWSEADSMKCYSCHKGRYSEINASLNDNTQANCTATGGTWSYAKNPLTGLFDTGICTPFLTMTSNGHQRLVGPEWIRHYPCTFCHAGTVTSVPQGAGNPPGDGGIIPARHVNYSTNVIINPYWRIDGGLKNYSAPSYNPQTKVCNNVYCHSDGSVDPDTIRDFPWNWRENGVRKHAECNACHGHPQGDCTTNCHDNKTKFLLNNVSTVLSYPQTGWSATDEWKSAMPMYRNGGVGSTRANSHPLHVQGKNVISCSECHYLTIPTGECTACHTGETPSGMGETAHLNPLFHVNKKREVSFRQGGTYNSIAKSCQSTDGAACHGSNTPKWGDSTDNTICLNCHGTTAADTDNYAFSFLNSTAAKINMTEWKTTGHGRMSSATSGPFGRYPGSNNPAANFPGNPCWYCHDSKVLHNYSGNPFRLKQHNQFSNRFDKECVYCHMQGTDVECLSCHNVDQATGESLAPQLRNISSSGVRIAVWPNNSSVHAPRPDHRPWETTGGVPSCMSTSYNSIPCHYVDPNNSTRDVQLHNSGAGFWSFAQKADVKNQYMSMGVCLKCHDDDSNNKCTGCHTPPADNPKKYDLGYDPGTGYIKPKKARASSVHFGFKHNRESLLTGSVDANGKAVGIWKGGKFCWDCHDPHGDTNIFMIHDNVATLTDGRFGIPKQRAKVIFTQKVTGSDYVQKSAPQGDVITGICNVCHGPDSRHYQATGGDSHNSNTICTTCHEHRFTDSHAEGNPCNTCHMNKPVPRHSGFGLPLDCVKCHTGSVGNRVDIIGQFKGQSHHVQGTPINNRHCYQCHWESTPEGMIDNRYHEGFNFNNYSTQKDKKVDLVIYGPSSRPLAYRTISSAAGRATATQFLAANIGSSDINTERKESAKVTNHCLSCHSDQNNDTKPFNDCKTPRQYAWDLQSIAARYSQQGVTRWGKYSSTTVNAKYKVTKALSAHGNAAANQGGWNPATGTDSGINNYRAGFTGMSTARKNVQCFDCHNSHGSKAGGVTSSYVSYSGLKNGGNIKEVGAGKGGYKVTYFAKANTSGANPYNAGAGQCFDCHMTAMKATSGTGVPWGYQSTFGATEPIKGYRDAYKFGDRNYTDPYAGQVYKLGTTFKQAKTIAGGHLKAATQLKYSTSSQNRIDGLCTPCHDPHGVSPTLGDKQQYAVPLLKDTWLSSPYKEDNPAPNPSGANAQGYGWGIPQYGGRKFPSTDPVANYKLDRNTLGTTSGTLNGTPKKVAEDETQFAGLCTRCHNKERLFGSYAFGTATSANLAPWRSSKRIHASVKGWGTNKEHAFTCSKCHQPHNSALPRLMQTNCLDYQHRGFAASGGTAWSSLKALANIGSVSYRDSGCSSSVYQLRGYPTASVLGGGGYAATTPEASISCHVSRFASGTEMVPAIRDFNIGRVKTGVSPASPVPSQWPDQNFWNSVTPWPLSK
ncbi:MAG: CxxxxCH/CxxCH domain-containing protein [Geobacter sp.]|nr:MAG: CxxxxCH/CxxCH domain-containing protein [Geobacter sp.]